MFFFLLRDGSMKPNPCAHSLHPNSPDVPKCICILYKRSFSAVKLLSRQNNYYQKSTASRGMRHSCLPKQKGLNRKDNRRDFFLKKKKSQETSMNEKKKKVCSENKKYIILIMSLVYAFRILQILYKKYICIFTHVLYKNDCLRASVCKRNRYRTKEKFG